MKKVAIIGTVGLPANYGGFETLASQLVSSLGNKYEFTVYCSGKKYAKAERKKYHMNARLKYLPFNANGIQSILYDTVSVIHALFYADVLLILGVAGAWIIPFVRLFTKKKIITSIDGIEWKREKWSLAAKIYLWMGEKIAVKYSHIDISDNESIQDYTAQRYGTLSRVIEYGGDHTYRPEATDDDHKKFPFLKCLYSIKVCRIEPENNVHVVLKAFENSSKQLVIVGNWNNSEYGRNLKKEFGNKKNIHLVDPIYDERTINLLRSGANLYIHGHSAGGTNPSLVEAMSLGLPVLAFNVSYNRTTTENKAVYFSSADDIANFVGKMSLEKCRKKAFLMKEIADRRYSWKIIAKKYDDMIMEVLEADPAKLLSSSVTSAFDNKKLIDFGLSHMKHQHFFYEKH